MKLKTAAILLIFCSLILFREQACAQSLPGDRKAESQGGPGTILEDYLKGYYSQVFGINISQILNPDLYSSIENWLGTPYRYAGKSLSGIDCSGFVNMIYDKAYCFLLSGNAADLFRKVTYVKKNDLREGDLVFFKIHRRNISHVGVYIGNNNFAHASSSNGVIISNLNSPYYKKYFVKGGRVNFNDN